MTNRDVPLLQRLQAPRRWPAADRAIRALGCAVLGCCALAAWTLYRAVHRPPAHPATIGELASGAASVICWALGWALVGEGQGLFRRVAVPGRHTRFTAMTKETR